jgi:hypothetical protein
MMLLMSLCFLYGHGCGTPREPVHTRALDSSVSIDGLPTQPATDARTRSVDFMPWPDLPQYHDAFASIHCAPKGQSSPCYSAFKQVMIECACSNGGDGSALAGCVSMASSYPYDIILDQLAKCVTINCPNLCSNGGYDTLLECAPQKCEPIAICCFGDGA